MVSIYKKIDGQLVQLEKAETGCWINIYPPFDHQNLVKIAGDYNIPIDYLTDALDIDERSRFESEDEIDLVVLNIPVDNDALIDNEAPYITIPIGIISTQTNIFTISGHKNPVIDNFIEGRIRAFDPADHSKFVLQVFERTVYYFLFYLKQLNYKRYAFEKELYNSSKNKELNNLLNLQKSLVYFVTNVRSNELMMLKIQRTNFLGIAGDTDKEDYFQDIIIDNSQAQEMSDIYTNILNGTMDAFASIISNNLAAIVQRLTAVTIILMVPTLVASFYGMNVPLPFEKETFAFPMILMISIAISILLAWFFLRKRLF